MLCYHSIYQCLQQEGPFSLTKAGERGVRLKDNRTESKLKADRAKGSLSEREREGWSKHGEERMV